MISTSQVYKSIVAGLHEFEWKIEINASTYYGTEIVRSSSGDLFARITRQTFPDKEPSIGNCLSSEFSVMLSVSSISIPRMATVIPYFRAVGYNGDTSDWYQAGVYYIDTRWYDEGTGTVTLTCFDGMLKADGEDGSSYYELTSISSWPQPADTVAADIASLIGVTIDSRSSIRHDFEIGDPGNLTMREVLGFIAAEHCGNWVMTNEGKLRLIPLCGNSTDSIDLGLSAENLEVMPYMEAWTKATLIKDNETSYSSGNSLGTTITAEDPWATSIKAAHVISIIRGLYYQPFTATQAFVDPAAELGDEITFTSGGRTVTSNIWSIDLVCDEFSVSTVSASGGNDIAHEYPYVPLLRRRIRRVEEQIEDVEEELPEQIEREVRVAMLRARRMDFSDWPVGGFYEILDNNTVVQYEVEFDQSGRPVKITDDQHECVIVWE